MGDSWIILDYLGGSDVTTGSFQEGGRRVRIRENDDGSRGQCDATAGMGHKPSNAGGL